MELLQVAKHINLKITELEAIKKELPALAEAKAIAIVKYEKNLAIEMEHLFSQGTPTTILEKLARGTCADEKGAMDLTDSAYKNCLKIIEITEAQLNGYQSINRYLSEA